MRTDKRALLSTPLLGVMAVALLPCLLNATQHPARRTQASSPVGSSSIHGRLTTSQGRELVRAGIILEQLDGQATWERVTNDAGGFSFDNLPAGIFLLSVSHSRYFVSSGEMLPIESKGRFLRLGPNQALRADVVAVRGGAVTGTVLDRYGEPITDVSVRAYRHVIRGGRRILAPAEARTYPSNDVGQYRVANLPPGKYVLVADYRGETGQNPQAGARQMTFAGTWYPGYRSADRAQLLHVRVGQDLAGIDFVLHPTTLVQVSGSVTAFAGSPAIGAEVMVSPAGEEGAATVSPLGARVSATGTFAISNLQPGDYVFRARSSPQPKKTGNDVRGEAPEYGSLRLSVGEHPIQGVSIHLRPGTRVRGQVQTDGTLPQRVAPSLVPDEPGGRTYRGSLSERGEFSMDVGPGRYRLAMTGLPGGWVVERAFLGTQDVTARPFAIQESMPQTLFVRLSPQGGVLAGYIEGSASRPCKDCAVIAIPENVAERVPAAGSLRLVRSDERGNFVISGLRAGAYLVLALPYLDMESLYDENFWTFVERHASRVGVVLGERKQIVARLAEGLQ